ncbi:MULTISPECIES: hypothetical protein [Nocardiaceae]|uniref:Phage integrase family protein n=1 Tax=Rhodococcoides kroppenstedtii TaxID=293050 RepID=A0ABS7NVK3_9NOCA|nr:MULTISPECIES: hypothetical protein [Rhodococcus]AMY20336.1 hypothetical protein A3Q40_02973 [Rhodococcus sp. PBTS 1]MBY6313926.1 hypothetical protein [Rhodococcus kroppenstedtii]MBY6321430.1 hypothetical protein [Rhodococcus kroppenstedtii]MBY6400128.1 hypothetical protein [Rhodococcus kroppenstedtii]
MTRPAQTSVGGDEPSIDPDEFVLRKRRLREDFSLEETPRFRDAEWRLDAAILQNQAVRLKLRFDGIPERYRNTAKEFMRALLLDSPVIGEMPRSITTIRSDFAGLKVFLGWLHDREEASCRDGLSLRDVRAEHLLLFQIHLVSTVPDFILRQSRRALVRRLWTYRQYMPTDHLAIDPATISVGWREPQPPRRLENSTPRIPEEILSPLLDWSMRFVDEFSPDIIEAHSIRLRWENSRTGGLRGEMLDEALSRLLREHVDGGIPLPGNSGAVNFTHISRMIGCSRISVARRSGQIQSTVETVGLGESRYIFPLNGTIDGHQWIDYVRVNLDSPYGLPKLTRSLIAACYVVIAFLSGMRDSEVKHLKRGCVRTVRDERGVAYRWYVSGTAFKGERDAAGTPATWVVGEPVARAIAVLERLQPKSRDWLFAHLDVSCRYSSSENRVYSSKATCSQVKSLTLWVNAYVESRARDDGIPDWHFTTRQFRRTLAWFIARRPGGSLAGAIQYRHLSVQMFEGYAGTSDSGFRAEVEAEEALARGEHLLAMIDSHQHEGLAGPAGQEAMTRLKGFSVESGFAGQIINDPNRLKRIMKKGGPEVYPGRYATCVFNPEKALCRHKTDLHGFSHPTTEECKPLHCRNVALTSDNIDTLSAEVAKLRAELVRSQFPPLLLDRLARRAEQIEEFLEKNVRSKS